MPDPIASLYELDFYAWANEQAALFREQRVRLKNHLMDNPSLRAVVAEAIVEAHEVAVIEAERETGLGEASFPAACPWMFDQIIDAAFWPGDVAH